MSRSRGFVLGGLLLAPLSVAAQTPVATELDSGTGALLQAISAVDRAVVWASGHDGAVLRSLDGGETWEARAVQTLDSLQFRDIHAFDAERAVLMSAGTGASSRIYRTVDGGATWTLAWLNDEPTGFYDCLDFWDEERGVAYGDAVDGELRILVTRDGGTTWRRVAGAGLPAALPGEGGFAASGTCVATAPGGHAWIGTGAGPRSRVLHSADFGETWTAVDLPIVSGEAAGAFTIVFSGLRYGVVLGGDLSNADGFTDNVAISDDGGRTWHLATRTPMPGAVYGAALAEVEEAPLLVAAGPGGLALTSDLTGPWTLLSPAAFWAVDGVDGRAWAVGPTGRILRLDW